jgi:hypothetical protein
MLTAPGETAAVSAFIEPMLGDLGVSRTALSTAYRVGTLTGAAATPAVGVRWIASASGGRWQSSARCSAPS